WTKIYGGSLHSGTYGTKNVPSSSNVIACRHWAVGWTDSSFNLYIFGGNVFKSYTHGILILLICLFKFLVNRNDLWKYDWTYWTWISGTQNWESPGKYTAKGVPLPDDLNIPGTRMKCASWQDSEGNFYLFGGEGHTNTTYGKIIFLT